MAPESATPEAARKRPNIIWPLAGLLVLLVIVFAMQLFGPSPRIVVSPQTTHLTSPLLPDGMPDFERHWRNRAKAGVTPENNAVALLLPVLWPGEFKPTEAPAIAAELGLEKPLTLSGALVYVHNNRVQRDIVEWLMQKDRAASGAVGESESNGDRASPSALLAERYDRLAIPLIDQAIRRPWTSEQLPPLAKWVAANQQLLDQIVAASRRTRFYMPSPSLLNNQPDMLYSMLLPGVQSCREVSRALPARAMWHLGEGRPMEAWSDILAVYRLAQLMSQDGQTLVEQLVAMAISGVAADATATLLDHARLTPEQARKIQSDLAALGKFDGALASLGTWERYVVLDSVINFSRDPRSVRSELQFVMSSSSSSLDLVRLVSVDWNQVLRHLNQRFDELAKAADASSRGAREAALAGFEASLDQIPANMQNPKTWIGATASRARRSEMVGDAMAALFLSRLTTAIRVEDRVNAQRELLQLAAALAVYRAENGQYPDKLDALVPNVLPAVPVDFLNSRAYVYRRDGEGYLLYSVGKNGVDEGGSSSELKKFEGRDWQDFSDSEWQDVELQMPRGSDDVPIRFPRRPVQLPTLPAGE